MCRLDANGRTGVRIHPDGRIVTPVTVCDHTTPLDAVLREIAFLEQHAAQQAANAPAQPVQVLTSPRPRAPRHTRGTPEERARARAELAAARTRTGSDPLQGGEPLQARG